MKANFLRMSLDSWELVLRTIGAQILAFFWANASLPLDLHLRLIWVHEMRLSSRRSELLCKSEQCWQLVGRDLAVNSNIQFIQTYVSSPSNVDFNSAEQKLINPVSLQLREKER